MELAEQQQLPVGRHLAVDERGVLLRATWRLDHGFINLSLWRDDTCVETFHLTPAAAAELVLVPRVGPRRRHRGRIRRTTHRHPGRERRLAATADRPVGRPDADHVEIVPLVAGGRPRVRGRQGRPLSDSPFPPGFFERADEDVDAAFYGVPRLVTHIDDAAILAVGELYEELGIDGDVLDLISSWISHFRTPPRHLRVLGMNDAELRANSMAAERIVHDLNDDPRIPLADASVDDVVCCVSVDYLTQPSPSSPTCPGAAAREATSCAPSATGVRTKAIRGWLSSPTTSTARSSPSIRAVRRFRGPDGEPPHAARSPRRPALRRVGHPGGGGSAQSRKCRRGGTRARWETRGARVAAEGRGRDRRSEPSLARENGHRRPPPRGRRARSSSPVGSRRGA